MNESVIFKQEIGQFPFFFTPAADLLGILQRDSLSHDLSISLGCFVYLF